MKIHNSLQQWTFLQTHIRTTCNGTKIFSSFLLLLFLLIPPPLPLWCFGPFSDHGFANILLPNFLSFLLWPSTQSSVVNLLHRPNTSSTSRLSYRPSSPPDVLTLTCWDTKLAHLYHAVSSGVKTMKVEPHHTI